MPTPRPMSSTSWEAKSGTERARDTSAMTATAVPSEARVVMSGRSMANSDPKAMSRTTPASTMPSQAPPSDSPTVFSASSPETATCRPCPWTAVAVRTSRVATAPGMFEPCWENVTVANPVVPLRFNWAVPPDESGDTIPVTPGMRPTSARTASIRAAGPGSPSRSPDGTAKTIRSVSPAELGATDCNSVWASVDWVCGSVVLSE